MPQGAVARLGRGLVEDVAFSPDGSKLAVLTSIGIYFHDSSDFAELAFIELDEMQSSIAFNPEGNLLTYGYNDGTISIYDTDTYTEAARLRVKDVPKDLYDLRFSPDGELIASGLGDGSIRLLDTNEGKEVAEFRGHSKPVLSLCFSPDGTIMASGGDENVVLWDLVELSKISEFRGHQIVVNSLSFSPAGKWWAGWFHIAMGYGTVYR